VRCSAITINGLLPVPKPEQSGGTALEAFGGGNGKVQRVGHAVKNVEQGAYLDGVFDGPIA
jgi:hypothetical protein